MGYKRDFPWVQLVHKETSNEFPISSTVDLPPHEELAMRCLLCSKFLHKLANPRTFAAGDCQNWRCTALSDHDRSTEHCNAVRWSIEGAEQAGQIVQGVANMLTKQETRLLQLFKLVYFMCKSKISIAT
jgi:hypothetical protein